MSQKSFNTAVICMDGSLGTGGTICLKNALIVLNLRVLKSRVHAGKFSWRQCAQDILNACKAALLHAKD